MKGKSPNKQRDLIKPLLTGFIDLEHELVLLIHKINWLYLKKEVSPLYSYIGKLGMPIRLMICTNG